MDKDRVMVRMPNNDNDDIPKKPLPLVSRICCSRRWILYLYSFITVSFAAGTVYGWPALRRKLRQEGSTLSEEQLGAVFTIGAWSTQGVRFFTGLLRDRFGTRRIAALALLCSAAGFVGVAWSDGNSVLALGISVFLIGIGSGVQLCTQPVAGLFPDYAGSVLASLSGAFQVSGLVFLVLAEMGNRKSTFTGFCFVLCGLAALAIWLLPNGGSFVQENSGDEDAQTNQDDLEEQKDDQGLDEKETESKKASNHKTILSGSFTNEESSSDININVHNPLDEGAQVDPERHYSTSNMRQEQSSLDISNSLPEEEEQQQQPNKQQTALQQILSLEYLFLLTWFSLSITPLQYYVGSIGFQLEEKGDDDGLYTTLYSVFYSAAAVLSPVGGWIADTHGLWAAEAVASALSATSFFCLASERLSLNGQIPGLICYGIGRMFVFGIYFAHVGKRFGYQNYGTLAGLGLILSALLSLIQYPMIAAASNGWAQKMNLLCGSIFIIMAPYFAWLARTEMRESRAEAS